MDKPALSYPTRSAGAGFCPVVLVQRWRSRSAVLTDFPFLRRDPAKPRAIEVRYDPSSGAAIERRPVRHVPLVGDVAAGTDVLAQENVEVYTGPVNFVKGSAAEPEAETETETVVDEADEGEAAPGFGLVGLGTDAIDGRREHAGDGRGATLRGNGAQQEAARHDDDADHPHRDHRQHPVLELDALAAPDGWNRPYFFTIGQLPSASGRNASFAGMVSTSL